MSLAIPSSTAILYPHLGEAPLQIMVRAEYFEGQIDLKRFRTANPHYKVLAADPLILETEDGRYAVITKFGAIVFWNCTPQITRAVLAEVAAMPNAMAHNHAVKDEQVVLIGAAKDMVGFNEIHIRTLSLEKMSLVSLALAQSVALELFEIEVAAALQRVLPVVYELQNSGTLKLSQNEVMRAVGFALTVRAAVLANLTLFDDPPETWESEGLAHLDSLLYDHFDLEERLAAINKKVDFLSDLNVMLMDILSVRKGHRLEWIIIILIVLELLFYLFEALPKFAAYSH
ncbi:hypothetical protein BH09SUM1_BH09SUM1_30640 [soil metagenome]